MAFHDVNISGNKFLDIKVFVERKEVAYYEYFHQTCIESYIKILGVCCFRNKLLGTQVFWCKEFLGELLGKQIFGQVSESKHLLR